MNNKKLSKVTKIATASFLIAGTTAFTAFAAMPEGTVVIGEKAFDINYANIPEHVDEISKAVVASQGKVYVKGFDGKWINNATKEVISDLAVIPAVEYKGKDGKVVKYQAKDGDVVKETETSELKVESVSAINLRQVEVKFGKTVNKATAENLANYTLNGGIELVPNQASAKLQQDGKTVIITLDNRGTKEDGDVVFDNMKEYRLTIEGIADNDGKVLTKVAKDFKTADTTLPTILSVATLPGSNAEIHVKFSEAMDPSYPGSYSVWEDGNIKTQEIPTATVSETDPTVVILTKANGFAVGKLEVKYNGGAKDFAGLQALPKYVGEVVAENQLEQTKLIETIAVDENTVQFKFNNPIAIPADSAFYWNRTGVDSDKIAQRQSVSVKRIDSYTVEAKFTGEHRLPKDEQVYVFAGEVKDTTGNDILAAKYQSFKVTAKAADVAKLISVRAEENTTAIVTFDKVMNDKDLEKAELYTLLDKDGKVVTGDGLDSKGHPLSVTKDKSLLQARITGLKLKGADYKLVVKDLKDGNENKVSGEKVFSIADVESPVFKGIEAVSLEEGKKFGVYIRFSEAMDVNTLKDENNYLIDSGNGLIKLNKNPNYIDIKPVNDNKGVVIRFNNTKPLAASAVIDYKVQFVKDLAGNVMDTAVQSNDKKLKLNNTALDLKAATKVTRVDGKTFTFELPRHLSFVDKADFLVGNTNIKDKAPASISFENQKDGTSKVTIVAQDSFGLKEVVNIQGTANTIQKASMDVFGRQFAKDLGIIAVNKDVSDSPKVTKAYVSGTSEITLAFNKDVKAQSGDFTVIDPTDNKTELKTTVVTKFDNKVVLTIVKDDGIDLGDKAPTVKVASMPYTQDVDGQKLEGNQSIATKNFFATNVRLIGSEDKAKTAEKIELSFNDELNSKSIMNEWSGNVDKDVTVKVDGQKITFTYDHDNKPSTPEVDANLGEVVLKEAAAVELNNKSAKVSMSADKKTLTIKLGDEGYGVSGTLTGATYTADSDIETAGLVPVNTGIEPETVTNFGLDRVDQAKELVKQELTDKIAEVATVENGKVEGEKVGNQVEGSKVTLEAAKTAAEGVLKAAESTTQQLRDATTALNTAIETYKAATVKELTGLTAPTLNASDKTTGSITGFDKADTEILDVTSGDTTVLTVDDAKKLGVTAVKEGKALVTVKVKDAKGNVVKVGTVEIIVAAK